MANIDKELNKIKHAIYGKEVRGSIHDGIDKTNKESEESKDKSDKAIKDSNIAKIDSSYAVSTSNGAINIAKTSNDKSDDTQQQLDNIVLKDGSDIAEVVQARGDEPLLKDRLNKTDQQLANTVEDAKFNNNAPMPIPIPTYEGSGQTVHPDVLYFKNRWNGYRYWMVHTPYPNTNEIYENPSIVASQDGVTWVVPPGLTNPLDQPTESELEQNVHLSDGVIFMVENTMEMWYRYRNKNTNEEYFLRRTSTNGIEWTSKEIVYRFTVDTSLTWGVSPTLVYENKKYRMWYVNGSSIWQTESYTGNAGSWTGEVRVNDHWGSNTRIEPWHIDVTKDPRTGKFNLIIATNPVGNNDRYLAFGSSPDGNSFGNTKLIMSPALNKTGWDNKSLYRASLVYVDDVYRLYYSAMNVNNQWKVGLVEGLNIDRMSGVLPVNQNGTLLVDNAELYNLRFKKNKFSLENIAAYFANNEIQLHERGLSSAKIVLEDDNSLSIRRENGDYTNLTLGSLITSALSTNSIRSRTGNGTLIESFFTYKGSSEEPSFMKLLDQGRADAGFRVGSRHAIRFTNGDGQTTSFVESSGLVIKNSGIQPPAEKGTIRFNFSSNKHEGHDGTKWNPLY